MYPLAKTLTTNKMFNYNTYNQSLSTFAILVNSYMFYHHQTITIFVTLTNMNCIITTLIINNIFSMCKVQIDALIPLLGNGYATEMQRKHVPYKGEISKISLA